MLPKNQIKSASAAGGSLYDYGKDEFSESALNALAMAAGYEDINDLIIDVVKNDTEIQGEKFGSLFINFGKSSGSGTELDWTPVHVSKSGKYAVLTLKLRSSAGWLTFTDGTAYAGTVEGFPITNMYSTSYIHACINAGQTSSGYYAGSFDASGCVMYKNDQASASGVAAPTAFTQFIEFTKGGKFSDYILPASATCSGGSYINDLGDTSHTEYSDINSGIYNYSYTSWANDNVWLPSVTETGESGGGTWGTTLEQSGYIGGDGAWLRSGNVTGYYLAHVIYPSGYYNGNQWGNTYAGGWVIPAINVNLSAIVGLDEPEDVETIYNGSAQTISNVAADKKEWYDSELMELTYSEGMTNAGTYQVKAELKTDLVDAGIKFKGEPDASKGETETVRYFNFKIKPLGIAVPTVLNATQTYKAGEYEFALKDYDKDLMTVKSDGYTSDNGSTITWDNTAGKEKFKATDAATYTVKFHMDSKNHIWSVGGTETASDQSKTITINKKELTINTTPAASSNPNWDYQATGSITYTATAAGISDPGFVLNVYYIKDGETSNPLTLGIDTDKNTLDVSKIVSAGKYKLCIELTSATVDTANKNYCIANDLFEMPFEINSGGIDFSKINWTYKEDGGNAAALFKADGSQEEIRYKQDDKNNAIKYYILGDIPAGEYLKIDTSYNSNGYKNGFLTTKDSATFNDGCSAVGTYKTRVALKTDTDHLFKSGDNYGSFGGDDTNGWYEIEWKIIKGKVSSDYLDNINKNLQYKTAGGSWQTYDPDNPPQFGSGAIEIRLDPKKYPAGITGAEITVNDKNTAIGNYTATVKLTYDDNYESEGNKTFTWSIGAMVIDVDWTSDFWKDGAGNNVLDANSVPYQIRVLNIKDDLKQYIDYKYYIADPNDPSVRGAYIGMNDTGLQDLINAPYNASSTNAVYIYVEAVLKSTATQYRLKDNTGNAYPNSMLYKLGATNTLVKVTLTATEMGYGDDKLKTSIISMLDTGTNGELDQSTYVEGIYIYDSANNNLGLLKDFDGTKASVGTYTIEIKLNLAGNDTYTLAPGSKYTFTVKAKAIPVPTVGDITFNNEFVNLTDYFGGSWADYKDIIKVGGTFDGVKNANTPYTATLTLTDSNYYWDYSNGIKPISFSFAANEMTCSGDDTVATYNWVINPYVLDASNWNLKGKDGAVYNVPANLISGLDVNVNYLYHTDKAGSALEDGASLSAGSTYFVKAELVGADAGNFVFKETGNSVSDFAQYKVPQSGVSAFFSKTWNFLKNNWWWLLIALAVLIFLIILIVVLVKRSKNKEEREEKKRLKEEEKERREEEKRRREEEREAEKERQRAELELAKAKQEAELAKMKAEAAAAAGIGAAGVAMAQPQQVQQPVQQAQPQIQYVQPAQPPVAPQPVQQVQPVQQAMPQPQYYAPQQPVYDAGALARLETEFREMRKEQRSDGKLENELLKLRLDMNGNNAPAAQQPVQQPMQQPMVMPMPMVPQYGGMGMPYQHPMMQPQMMYMPVPINMNGQHTNGVDDSGLAEKFGQMMASMMKSMGVQSQEKPTEMQVQSVEESASTAVNAPTVYPPDAVVTTTTTVDTTNKNKAQPRTINRDDGRLFDIDGFYDAFDGK